MDKNYESLIKEQLINEAGWLDFLKGAGTFSLQALLGGAAAGAAAGGIGSLFSNMPSFTSSGSSSSGVSSGIKRGMNKDEAIALANAAGSGAKARRTAQIGTTGRTRAAARNIMRGEIEDLRGKTTRTPDEQKRLDQLTGELRKMAQPEFKLYTPPKSEGPSGEEVMADQAERERKIRLAKIRASEIASGRDVSNLDDGGALEDSVKSKISAEMEDNRRKVNAAIQNRRLEILKNKKDSGDTATKFDDVQLNDEEIERITNSIIK